MAYIYKIYNDINDKLYIGKTEFSIEKRFKEHKRDARSKQFNRPLCLAINKYGEEHFFIEEIEQTDKPDEREIYWIEKYNSYHNGYNATLGGDGTRKYDYNLILQLFDEHKYNQKEIAQKIGCDSTTIKKVVQEYRGDINWLQENLNNGTHKYKVQEENFLEQAKQVLCIEDNITFHSITAAADWLSKEKGYSKKSMAVHICLTCQGKQKTCGGYHWKYI